MTGPSPEAPERPRLGLRGLLFGTGGVVVWSVLVGVLLVGATVLAVQARQAQERVDVRQEALQAARQSALNLTSVDGTDIEEDLARVLEGATGTFRTEFEAQADQLRTLLAENEVRAEGTVLEAALTRADESTATALVVVDSLVSNVDAPEGQRRSYRVQLDLERVGARWLTSSLQFVG